MDKAKFIILISTIFLLLYELSPYFTSKEVLIVKEGEVISDSSCYEKLMVRGFGEFQQIVCRTKIKWHTGKEEVVNLPFCLLKGERVRFCKVINRYFFVFPYTHYEYRRGKF